MTMTTATTATMPTMAVPALELREVAYRYPGAPAAAVAGVTLAAAPGEVVAIAGESGSGKSTLARLVAGLLRPDAGSVRVGGVDLRPLRPRAIAGRVGIVFQRPNDQLLAWSVRDELALGPRNRGLEAEVVQQRVARLAVRFGLDDVLDEHPYRLPLPARRRLALASIVAVRPPVLVLDEPTAGLDAAEVATVAGVIRDAAAATDGWRAAILVVTHDLGFAASIAERLVVLRGGTVVAEGEAEALLVDAGVLDAAALQAPPLVRVALALGVDPSSAVRGSEDELAAVIRRRGGWR